MHASIRLVPLLALAFPAAAAAAPAPASQHKPPVILDEASFYLDLYTSDGGYKVRSYVELAGFTSATDILRIDWVSKGKVVATGKCDVGVEDGYATGECDIGDKALTVAGPIEARLIYWDDQEEKEYLVRTAKVTVQHWKGKWDAWQVMPDDVLAAAWMWMGHADDNDDTYHHPTLYLWFTNNDVLHPVLRCKVGDKKLADITLHEQSGSDVHEITADTNPLKGEPIVYRWVKKKFLIDLYWGERATLTDPKVAADTVLSDNPGAWSCGLRNEGKTLRTINFTVGADGRIQQDEIQTGKNPIPTVSPNVVLVDVRLTKDSASFDTRIDPAAMKKSMGYGLPWPDHAKVKEIQASYPAKSGYPDPK